MDRLLYLAISSNRGKSWSDPIMVGAPGVKEASLPGIAVGDAGKVALIYMGSTNSPGEPWTDPYAEVTWNGYMAISADALAKQPVFYTGTVNNPREPLIKGQCGPFPLPGGVRLPRRRRRARRHSVGVVRRRLHRRELQCEWAVPPPRGSDRRTPCRGAEAPLAPTQWETGRTDAVSRIVAGHYSAAAEGYRSLWAPELLELARRLLDELPLTGARRVLDSGAGVGSLLPEIATRAASAVAFGVDVSEGMVALTRPGIPVAVADSCRLPFGSRTFDVGILAFVLFHLPDPIDGLNEMSRVLCPGGTVGTITWGSGSGYRARDVWLEALDEHHAAPIESGFAKHELVDSADKIRHLLARTGFEAVRTWTGEYESRLTADEFLAHRTGHGESRRRFESLDEHTRAELLRDVRARFSELGPEDFVQREDVVYATARTPN